MSWSIQQYDTDGLNKPPRWSQVVAFIRVGEVPPHMGTEQPALSEDIAHAGQVEPWSRHIVLGWRDSRVMESTPQMFQMIWDIFRNAEVNLFASEDNSHCKIYFSVVWDALAHG